MPKTRHVSDISLHAANSWTKMSVKSLIRGCFKNKVSQLESGLLGAIQTSGNLDCLIGQVCFLLRKGAFQTLNLASNTNLLLDCSSPIGEWLPHHVSIVSQELMKWGVRVRNIIAESDNILVKFNGHCREHEPYFGSTAYFHYSIVSLYRVRVVFAILKRR